jgi:hypothetical protein
LAGVSCLSGCQGWQADEGIIAERGDCFQMLWGERGGIGRLALFEEVRSPHATENCECPVLGPIQP